MRGWGRFKGRKIGVENVEGVGSDRGKAGLEGSNGVRGGAGKEGLRG